MAMRVARLARLARRSLCTGDAIGPSSSPQQWLAAHSLGKAPALRFPLGTPVKCFVGEDDWVSGSIVAHNFREPSWPDPQPTAPYQVLLDEKHQAGERNAIWAPADVDAIIRTNFRFDLGDGVEVRVAQDEWVSATVVGHLYQETGDHWPENQYAPYQVSVEGGNALLPGAIDAKALGTFGPQREVKVDDAGKKVPTLIWLPHDSNDYIRQRCPVRRTRLEDLRERRSELGEEAYASLRREAVHAPAFEEEKL